MKRRHVNIPIFIPHEGCPNACVFCNQHTITQSKNGGSSRDVTGEIEECLKTVNFDECECEIAFFGGSFTGIPRGNMIRLLESAAPYLADGRVKSIRLSTRPDFIDGEILDILSRYGVRHIELGIQSLDDGVLSASKRGHTAECTRRACALIKEYGFSLTGQMMIGLPSATLESELLTAREICDLGCDSARVYPTMVFYDTELCEMARCGKYTPLTNDEATERCAAVCEVFFDRGVELLRIGLQANESTGDDKIYGGANHSAIGELSLSRIYFKRMREICDSMAKNGELLPNDRIMLTVFCAEGEVSKVSGQKRVNKEAICDLLRGYGVIPLGVKVKERCDLRKMQIIINVKKEMR